MILTSRAPVSWPTPTQLDVAWADSFADLELQGQDDDGHYRLDAASAPMRLVRGSHLQTGASYDFVLPELTAASATLDVTGRVGARVLDLAYRVGDRADPTSYAGVSIDCLERFVALRSASTLPELRWELTALPAREGLIRLAVDLPWLRVRLATTVETGADGGDELVTVLELDGTGLWHPVVSTMLAATHHWARQAADELTTGLATSLGDISRGVRVARPVLDDPPLRMRTATAQMRLRLHRVQDEVELRSGWRQHRWAWRTAYAAQPPVTWPADSPGHGWARIEQDLAARLARTGRDERRAAVDRLVDEQVVAWTDSFEQERARAAAAARATPPLLQVADGAYDLRWLRSPYVIWRHAKKALTDEATTTTP